MSNDLFDKKIKEELESARRQVSSGLWQKIQKQRPLPWYFDFGRRFGFPVYSFITTLALLWGIKKYNDIEQQFKLLNDKISEFRTLEPQSTEQTIVHKDTIYIEKTIFVINKQSSVPDLATEAHSETGKNEVQEYLSSTPKTTTGETTTREESTDETKNRDKKAGDQENTVVALKEESLKDSTHLIIPKKTLSETPPEKKFSWPKLNSRVGIAGGAGFDRSNNLGAVFELFFRKDLSVSSGILINNYPENEYGSARHFNVSTGKNFEQIYKPHLPEKYDRLAEIQLKTTIVELPINLNYYLPLTRKLDLKFSFGSHIDLRTFQSVRFETYQEDEETYTRFNNPVGRNYWHNLNFSAGLQYKPGKFAFQLSPGYWYSFREVDYLPSGSSFRINGSVLIDLRK